MSTTASGEVHLRLGAIALGLVPSLVAQSDRGSIAGIVTDSTEAVFPRVTVVVHECGCQHFPRDAQHRKREILIAGNYRWGFTTSRSSSSGASIIGSTSTQQEN